MKFEQSYVRKKAQFRVIFLLVSWWFGFGLLGQYFSLTNRLVAYYPFSGSGRDESGNGNHGTLVGVTATKNRFGEADSAYEFDGGGYINIENKLLLNGATQATITGWIYVESGSPGGFVVGAGDSRAGLDPFQVSVVPGVGLWGSRIFSETTRGGSNPTRSVGVDNWQDPDDSLMVPLDRWIFFAQIFRSESNSSVFQFYVDGIMVQERKYDYSLTVRFDKPMPVQIGALTSFSDSRFHGKIDDIRFYDVALSPSEVALMYQYEGRFSEKLTAEINMVHLSVALILGKKYQLESSSGNQDWVSYGPPFIASLPIMNFDVNVINSRRFFRVREDLGSLPLNR